MVINQNYALINKVTKQAMGKIPLEVTDASSFVAFGNKYIFNSSQEGSRDIWTKSLVDVLTDIECMDRGLRVESLDIERNERDWGSVRARVYMKPIEARHNTEYDLNNTAAFNPFEIVTPETAEILFSNHSTFEFLVTIPKNQLFSAFQNEGQFQAFIDFIQKQITDGMTNAMAGWERMAVANYIGEKIAAHRQGTAGKMHAINILAAYNTQANTSGTTLTVAKMWTDPEFLKFYANKMIELKNALIKNYTDVFNTSDGFMSQVPESFLKVYVNQAIASKLGAYLYSDTYHNEFVKLDGYKEVEYWQAMTKTGQTPLSEDARTSLDVVLASDGTTEISQTGVLAVLFDKDAIASFYHREEAEMIPVYTKGTNYYRSVTAEYINDLFLNGIVIFAQDVVTNENES